MKRRKGQIISQAFVLILAAMVFVMILTFGYRWLRDLREESDRVSLIKVVKDLENEVKAVQLNYGTTKKLEINGIPSKYKTICFVTGRKLPDTELKTLKKEYPLIYDTYEPGGSQNVFLMPTPPITINIPNIVASDKPKQRAATERWFCMPIDQGTIVLYLEGLGNQVLVTEFE